MSILVNKNSKVIFQGFTGQHASFHAEEAMAMGTNNAWGFGWAGTRGQAEHNAVSFCLDYGAACQPVVWACSY